MRTAAAAALADRLLAGLAVAAPEEAAAGFFEEDASLVAMLKGKRAALCAARCGPYNCAQKSIV